MEKKGQTAVEYLVTTSFLLVVTGIIFAYALFIYTDSTVTSTAKSAVSSIVNTVDQAQALGPENVLYTEVEIPANVYDATYFTNPDQNVTVFVLRLQTSAGLSDVARNAKGIFLVDDAALCMLKHQGRYKVRVAWLGGDRTKVCVDDGYGNCQTNCSAV